KALSKRLGLLLGLLLGATLLWAGDKPLEDQATPTMGREKKREGADSECHLFPFPRPLFRAHPQSPSARRKCNSPARLRTPRYEWVSGRRKWWIIPAPLCDRMTYAPARPPWLPATFFLRAGERPSYNPGRGISCLLRFQR